LTVIREAEVQEALEYEKIALKAKGVFIPTLRVLPTAPAPQLLVELSQQEKNKINASEYSKRGFSSLTESGIAMLNTDASARVDSPYEQLSEIFAQTHKEDDSIFVSAEPSRVLEVSGDSGAFDDALTSILGDKVIGETGELLLDGKELSRDEYQSDFNTTDS
jgi:hypothetical protein